MLDIHRILFYIKRDQGTAPRTSNLSVTATSGDFLFNVPSGDVGRIILKMCFLCLSGNFIRYLYGGIQVYIWESSNYDIVMYNLIKKDQFTLWSISLYSVSPSCLINFLRHSVTLQPPSARDNEKCASQIANNLSKKFGPGWNAVVGEAFSFEISYTKWVDNKTKRSLDAGAEFSIWSKSTWLTSSINVTVWQNVCFKCSFLSFQGDTAVHVLWWTSWYNCLENKLEETLIYKLLDWSLNRGGCWVTRIH